MKDVMYAPKLRHQRGAGLECLERRELLSADAALGQFTSVGQVLAAEIAGPTRGAQHFEVSIVGTEVSYSPAGLPSDMKGTVYFDNAAGAPLGVVGTYDETLQPIFAPVGPGGSPAFVGATGLCTFDFGLSLDNAGLLSLGSITASDTALIEGASPDGTLLVGSSDSPITASTGICQGLTGSFDGQSDVKMGAVFSMHTTVEFTVQGRSAANVDEMLTVLAVANSFVAQAEAHEPVSNPTHGDDDGASYAALYQLDRPTDRYAAADNVFASDWDPFTVNPVRPGHGLRV